MSDLGFTVIAVALDESAEDVREYAEGITYPVLIDSDRVLTELYAVSNVPTVVWVEADGSIARPNAAEPGTDMFIDFTGHSAAPHMEAVRDWVRTGTVPDDSDVEVTDLDETEIRARLAFRIALQHRRTGDTGAAEVWFQNAVELAPVDYTIRRAAMPLRGDDPFGSSYFELLADWKAAGSPFHGLSRSRDSA